MLLNIESLRANKMILINNCVDIWPVLAFNYKSDIMKSVSLTSDVVNMMWFVPKMN